MKYEWNENEQKFQIKNGIKLSFKKRENTNPDCEILFNLQDYNFSKIISKYTTKNGVLKISQLLQDHLIIFEDLTKDCLSRKEFTADINVIYGATDIIVGHIDNMIGDVNINIENQSRKKEKSSKESNHTPEFRLSERLINYSSFAIDSDLKTELDKIHILLQDSETIMNSKHMYPEGFGKIEYRLENLNHILLQYNNMEKHEKYFEESEAEHTKSLLMEHLKNTERAIIDFNKDMLASDIHSLNIALRSALISMDNQTQYFKEENKEN